MIDDHKGRIGATATILRLCQLFQVKLFNIGGRQNWQTGNAQTSYGICHIWIRNKGDIPMCGLAKPTDRNQQSWVYLLKSKALKNTVQKYYSLAKVKQ